MVSVNENLAPVYVITYDHVGIILWHLEALKRVFDQEIERLERHPTLKLGWDHEAYTYDYLAEHAPELLARIKEALARFRGRLGVGTCTYGQPLSQFISEESNVRQLTMALETTEEHLGVASSVYIMAEHAMHSQTPQLLVGCGFRGAIMRTHFMMYGYNPSVEAPVIWWVGLDGSHIPAVPTYPGQEEPVIPSHAQPFGAVTLDNRILTDYPNYPQTLEAFRRRYGQRIRPLVASRLDDPRQREEIIAIHEMDPNYTWVLADEVFSYLPQPRLEFQTTPNDFGVRMPWGFCGHWIWNQIRRAETSVLIAERLAALEHALSNTNREADLKAAWKNLLVGQHHDIQIVGLENDAHTYLDTSIAQSSRVIEEVMQTFARRIGARRERRWVVFSPVPWERADWIDTGDGTGFVAKVPGLGWTAFSAPSRAESSPVQMEWNPGERHLRTMHYDLILGDRCGFTALRDRRTGRHLLLPGRPNGTLAALINGVPCESQGTIEVQVVGERTLVQETGMIGPLPYRVEWVFYAALPRIDWHCELEAHGEVIGRPSQDMSDPYSAFEHEHKLRLRFYPAIRVEAVGIRDLPFAVAETTGRYVEGLYWTAVSDGHIGLALLNRGLMGSLREADGAFSVPLAFSMYYVWDRWDGLVTDQAVGPGPHFMKGTYHYELGVIPFLGNWRAADIHSRAVEYNLPCMAMEVDELMEPLGSVWTPLQIEGKGAILSALYTRDRHTYARFYEYQGQEAAVSLKWMGCPVDLIEVNLREQPSGALGQTLHLGPWQVRTVALRDISPATGLY